MIAELGVVGLSLGLTIACLIGLVPMGERLSAYHDWPNGSLRRLSSRLTHALLFVMALAFTCLLTAYATSDFSVASVAANSYSAKPLVYKISGAWGNHEGSLVLWVMVLALYMAAFNGRPSQQETQRLEIGTLAQCGWVMAGFLLFILATSNPFTRVFPPLTEGQGLNPLLQDIGLAIHPPMLYAGYVGFAVVFALGVAAMRSGFPIDARWARIVRPWTLTAWSFLTLGISLGSWWAYRELGWGGWWFWDPVENASLMPWLAGTALVHSLVALERRGHFAHWSLLLAILSFTLSLLGTFLVRSGILSSVHSFANDPARGIYVLVFTTILCGSALWTYALRSPTRTPVDFTPGARESMMMLQNLIQMTLCGTIMLGVLYPLALQLLNLPSITVGAPYFEKVFVPLAAVGGVLAAIAPLTIWRHALPKRQLRERLNHVAITMVLTTVAASLLWQAVVPFSAPLWPGAFGLWLGVWLAMMTVAQLYQQGRVHLGARGMAFAHLGLALVIAAVSLSAAGRMEQETLLSTGETVGFGPYTLRLAEGHTLQGPNYSAQHALVEVYQTGQTVPLMRLQPELRFFPERGTRTSEAAIISMPAHDLYAVVGDMRDGRYLLRFYLTPGMGLLWIGFVFAAFGGTLAALHAFRHSRKS